jgi:AcrR family transcriptional regulator
MATQKQRQRIVDALLALAAERRWSEISLADIAEKAEVPLATLREAFPTRAAILADFSARIDAEVIEGRDPEMAGEPARDRILDTVMRRFDRLAPYKAGIRGLVTSARSDASLALALTRIGCISQPWMLAAAGIEASSPMGRLRAAGLGLVYARILPVWLDDDDPGLARTLAALDKALTRGEKALHRAEDIGCRLKRFAERCRGDRKAEKPSPTESPAADAGAV